MRFASRLILRARRHASLAPAVAVMIAALGFGGGCENQHIGRPCDPLPLGVDAGASNAALISSPALECPSRICLRSPQEVALPTGTTATGPLCTAPCSSNDDCADAEGTSDKGSSLCKQGFFCGIPTTVGPFCCQKMCICRDLVAEQTGGFQTPKACLGSSSTCPNVH